jgi:hypothetical protein
MYNLKLLTLKKIPQNATNAFATMCNWLSFVINFNCLYNYFAPLTILTTMLQLHLQIMISPSYILQLFLSMIMLICPLSYKWNQFNRTTNVST